MKIMTLLAAALSGGVIQNGFRKHGTMDRYPYHALRRPDSSSINKPSSNKFTPHQGKRECSRRVIQRLRAVAKEAI